MPETANDKATTRSRFVNDRLTLGNHLLRQASRAAVARLLRTTELTGARTVCAYVSFGTEPDTESLIEGLFRRGVEVLLPVLLADGDLDWARHDTRPGSGALVAGRLGLREPAGERLGPGAIRTAQAVIVPALAVSPTGQRLGRGGGSYDRALARLADLRTGDRDVRATAPWVCALVYDHELDAEFPVQPHDQPVDAACSAERIVRFTPPGPTAVPS